MSGLLVAIVSGGIDSISYLAQWLVKGYNAHVLTFNYGQKGVKEVSIAKYLVDEINKLGIDGKVLEFKVIDISFMRDLWRGLQLTDESVSVS
ncbi:MAG: 7-cyano-7-deazaguanine synthase, partial [Sulfolobales archaeon]